MAANPPYFPSQLAFQQAWLLNFNTLLSAAPITYGLVAGNATAVAAVFTPFNTAYALCLNPATTTSAQRLDRDTKLAACTAVVFPFATNISQNASVTNQNKTTIGVTVRSTVRTVIPPTTDYPIVTLRSQANGVCVFDWVSSVPGPSIASPYGYTPRIRTGIHPTLPTPVGDLQDAGKFTRSPFTKVFPNSAVGDVITIAMNYEKKSGTSGAGVEGPVGPAVSFVLG